MNESLFVTQILFVFLFSYGALKLGKEALMLSVCVQAITANLFVLKQISLFGFRITCSDAFAIGSLLSLHLLREYFGKESAKKATLLCFFFMVFFVFLSQIHLRFVPSPSDRAHIFYANLLGPSPRLLFASIATFALVQQFDIRAFGWISKALPHSRFPIRSNVALILSQLLDTLLFTFLGLYGLIAPLQDILLVSFLAKTCMVLLMSPLLTLYTRWQRDV